MAIIKEDNNIMTLINVYNVDSSDQQKLVDMLTRAIEQIYNKQEGFISASIHKSIDGTKVTNYLQWKSKESIEKMLKNTKVIIHMNDILTISKLDGALYDVVFVEDKA